MKGKKIKILCLQETRWKSYTSQELSDEYKRIYYVITNRRNGFRIMLNPNTKQVVFVFVRQSDRIISYKILIAKLTLIVVSTVVLKVVAMIKKNTRSIRSGWWSELFE